MTEDDAIAAVIESLKGMEDVLAPYKKKVRRHVEDEGMADLEDMDAEEAGEQNATFRAEVDDTEVENGPQIVRVKTFTLKPMSPDEACLQMEMLGHDFFVFKDEKEGNTCVVYRRNDGNYGLIKP